MQQAGHALPEKVALQTEIRFGTWEHMLPLPKKHFQNVKKSPKV
jgi:hypothetical protein